jgi:hypothetical protein
LAHEQAIEQAILRTLLYADIFEYPLTPHEISHWAIGLALTPEQVSERLAASAWLGERVERVNGYVAARGRADQVVPLRIARGAAARRFWPAARRYARLLGHLPYVRMVAVTGALAVDNADAGADIDLLIVSVSQRVWLVRAFAVALVRLARLEGVPLCPNYVVAETALVQQRRDLFIAHEIVQTVPLVGQPLFTRLLETNPWYTVYVPNARGVPRAEAELGPGRAGRALQSLLERLFDRTVAPGLERWERERKLRKFAAQAQRAPQSAIIDADQVKGHFDDYGEPTLRRYRERLVAFELDEWP